MKNAFLGTLYFQYSVTNHSLTILEFLVIFFTILFTFDRQGPQVDAFFVIRAQVNGERYNQELEFNSNPVCDAANREWKKEEP